MIIICKMTDMGPQELGRVAGEKLTGIVVVLTRMRASLGANPTDQDWLVKFHGSYLCAEQSPLSNAVGDSF
jgi:hypothetical protein